METLFHIALLEDDEIQQQLLYVYLCSKGFEVYVAGTVSEFEAILRSQPVDVALVDLSLPGESGMTVIAPLRESTCTGVIVLSSHSEQETKLQALNLGADDYLTKPFHLDELLVRIHNLIRRLERANTDKHRTSLQALLSEREMVVLRRIANGWTGKKIAEWLEVSPRTVDTYRNRIASKLKLKSKADFARIAVQAGLVN